MWESARKFLRTTEALFFILTVLFVAVAGLAFFLASIASIQRESIESTFSFVVGVESTWSQMGHGEEHEKFACTFLSKFNVKDIRRKTDKDGKDGHDVSEWFDVCSMNEDSETGGSETTKEDLDVLNLNDMGFPDYVRVAVSSMLSDAELTFRIQGTTDDRYPIEFTTGSAEFRDKLLDRAREILLQTAVVAIIVAGLIWVAIVQFVSKPINEIKRRIKIGGDPESSKAVNSGSAATAEIQDLVDLTNKVVLLVRAGRDASGVWHDLKELSGIQMTSIADLNGLRGADRLTGLQGEIVSNLQKSLKRSKVILEMLLNFASGEIMRVKIRKLVDDVVRAANSRELCGEMNVEFEISIDGDPEVEIVEPSIFLALNNLVQNSQRAFAKCFKDGARRANRVHISVKENSAEVSILVQDNGPGIEPGKLEDLLDGDLPRRDEETGGYGIGFYAAKVSAKLHAGSLNLVESRHMSQYPDISGTCFNIVLPKFQDLSSLQANFENPNSRHCIDC